MCSVQTQSPFSLDLKITCHPPPLHNSISVSIKVGRESFKTEKRHTIRCLPWKPFHCQLGKDSVCVSVREPTGYVSHWQCDLLLSGLSARLEAAYPGQTPTLHRVFLFKLKNIVGSSYRNNVGCNFVFKSRRELGNSCSSRKHQLCRGHWILAVLRAINVP